MSTDEYQDTGRWKRMPLKQRIKSNHNNGNGWERICIPVDNSEQSERAIDLGVRLAKHFNYSVSGIHVFNSELHRKRFRSLLPHLPEKFRTRITEKMEKTHDAIMDLSFKHLGEELLDVIRFKAEKCGIEFESKILDGNPAKEIENYVNQNGCGLVMMGSSGQGKSPRIGGCARKIARRIRKDIILVRDNIKEDVKIVVAIDGSDFSFSALRKALLLAHCLKAELLAISVYDPNLHVTIFESIKKVLTSQDEKLFNSKKQENLHNEVIDNGIRKVYESALYRAECISLEVGKEIKTQVRAGIAFEKIIEFAQSEGASFLVFSRFGLHKALDSDIGSVAENLIVESPCNVLLCCN